MSKEKAILQRIIDGDTRGDFFISNELLKEIDELLAQFEQDPVTKEPKGQVAWGLYDLDSDMFISIYGYEERPDKILKNRFKWVKVYLAPPELEPVELEDVIKQLHNKCYQTSFDTAPVIAVRDALTIFRNYLKSKRDITAK